MKWMFIKYASYKNTQINLKNSNKKKMSFF